MSTNIRNFVIIAHIDHGKSTLADRLLEITGTVEKRLMKEQFLDQLESERERGITIKMAPVRMLWRPENSKLSNSEYILNLIDTPGHSDFKYEVSRALAAVEGAVLLVDATQGIQAQTLANFENAQRAGLTIIGAVNKIDVNPPQLEEVVIDLANLLRCPPEEILRVSGKTGRGVSELLEKIVGKIPPPTSMIQLRRSAKAEVGAPTVTSGESKISRGLIFDSLYDDHKGIIAFVRLFDGAFKREESVDFLATGTRAKIKEVGYFHPKLKSCPQLTGGEIGYIATGIKNPVQLKIGDTILSCNSQFPITNYQNIALPGYNEPQPVVFVSFYPENPDDYEDLKQALSRLRLNDAALTFEPDMSEVLGRGFKGGFLGRLHFEITAERLQKEFGITTVHSFPSVAYRVHTKGSVIEVRNPKEFIVDNDGVEEPIARVEILTPPQYLGSVLSLRELFRFSDFQTTTMGNRILLVARLPLADLISDLDDKLKSLSAGYASLNYELVGYENGDLEKLEILVAGHVVPGLTRILPKEKVPREARQTVERLRELLPRQQFTQALQAAVRGKIIARETVPAMRKDVTGYLYGGDRTRKMKLWKKQQKGKARLKEIAEQSDIKIPASIFKELLKK